MADYIINIITPAVGHLGVLGYWIAFFAAMLETTIIVGLFLPGSTVILLININPDVDAERDYFYNDLIQTKKAGGFRKIQLVKPGLGRNFTGDPFFTDGEAYLIKLKAVD